MKKNIHRSLEDFIQKNIPVFSINKTVGEVITSIRRGGFIDLNYIYTIDEAKLYCGMLKTGPLLEKGENLVLKDLLSKDLVKVEVTLAPEKLANMAIQKQITSVPVVNKEGQLLGAVTSGTIMEILRKEHVEDLHKLAGIRKEDTMAREALNAPPYRRAKDRLPWLLAGLAGCMVSTFTMSAYEHVLNENIAIAFFIPGIVYLADAVGTQTETIAVRGLSLSSIPFKNILAGEAKAGMIIGGILGVVSFPMIIIFFGLHLALAVSLSITAAGTVAATIGLVFPWGLSRFKMDPAFGSGPLATIIQDILSILIYFLMINWFL